MEHSEGNFKAVRNAKIYYQAWLPEGNVKSVLLIVHGLGEHCGRYMNVVNHFVPLGYAVYGLDHLGHGRSAGEREVILRVADYTGPLTTYCEMVRGWQPGKPIFLLGHSMGGLIATYYLLDNQDKFRGAILSAPAIKISANISPATITLSRILSAIAPRAGVLALDAAGVSSDPEVVHKYINDPLVFHGKTPARLGAEMLRAMLRVAAELGKITLPFIAVQGGADRLVDPGAAQMLYDGASSLDKTLRVYAGYFHEVFNEPGRAVVLNDVEAWLAAHL